MPYKIAYLINLYAIFRLLCFGVVGARSVLLSVQGTIDTV